MAASTLTAATYDQANVRSVHTGNFAVHMKFEYSAAKTVSVSDIVLMGFIPQNCTVLDAMVWGAFSDGASTFKVGTPSSISAIGTTTTITAAGVNRPVGFLPRRFSLSGDAEGNLRIPIAVKRIAGTSTATGSINLVLICTNSPLI